MSNYENIGYKIKSGKTFADRFQVSFIIGSLEDNVLTLIEQHECS